MDEDSLIRVETESRHALLGRDMLIWVGTCLLQTSFLGWSLPLTLALVILMHYLEVKRTQEICIRCSIQIRTALSKPSSQRIVFQIVSTKLYCTEAACVSELRRNVSASSGLPSRFWRERGKRGISDLYRRRLNAARLLSSSNSLRIFATCSSGGEVKTNKQVPAPDRRWEENGGMTGGTIFAQNVEPTEKSIKSHICLELNRGRK